MSTWAITFGVQYSYEPHPSGHVWIHPDGWLEVEADDEQAAREMARAVIGLAWAFIYPVDYARTSRYYPLGALARLYPSADPIAAQEVHEDGTCAAIITADLSMVLHVLTSAPWLELAPLAELQGYGIDPMPPRYADPLRSADVVRYGEGE